MRSTAGTSAREGYRAGVFERRRAARAVAGLVALAGLAGWSAVQVGGRAAGLLAVIALGGGISAVLVWRGAYRTDPGRWLRAAEGEAATALELDRLPRRSWFVAHDLALPGSRANVDHLVIGPSGVWVIDTKTTRAVVRAGWGRVWFGERRLDPGPVRWEARVVADRLGVRARPLIVVHGGLRRRGARCGRVRVLPPSRVARYLRWRRPQLDRGEVAELAAEVDRVFHPWGGLAKAGRP